MTKDSNKGVNSISYNLLNLPSLLDINNRFGRGRNTYMYAADGTKLQVKQQTGSSLQNTLTTDYIGNKIYENGSLKRILVDGGYIQSGTYYYYLTDHLGSVRLTVKSDGTIAQKMDYYPFGMLCGQLSEADQSFQPYKYNGKEMDRMAGLNLYDYGARYMDPAVGRFTTIDPLAEKYYNISPYAYCGNNPVNRIDPDGRSFDGYLVDEYGYLERVNNEGGGNYNVIYRKSEYSDSNKKDYDESGTRRGLKVNTYKGLMTVKMPVMDQESHSTGKTITNNAYLMGSDQESQKVLEFLEGYVEVEVGNTFMQNEKGENMNLIRTSHEESTITGSPRQINKLVSRGYKVVRDDHTQPNSPNPSDKKGDKGFAADVKHYHSPNATFRILFKGKYYPYDEKEK